MKLCKMCNKHKEYSNFTKSKTNKDGFSNYCKKCISEKYKNKYYKDYYNNNKEKKSKYGFDWREKNSTYNKEYFQNNKEKIREYYTTYNFDRKDDIKNYQKAYYISNKETLNKKQILYKRMVRKTYPKRRLAENTRNLIKNSIKNNNYKKKNKTIEILNCSFAEFKIYLESKFEPWMSWDNYGKYNGELNYGWDIDHIIPLSSAETEEDIIKLNHFTNLQPLCSYINRIKKRNNCSFYFNI